MLVGFEHIGMRVADLDRSLAFYVGLLGLALRLRKTQAGGGEVAFLDAGGGQLEISQLPEPVAPARPLERLEAGLRHITLAFSDLDETFKRLVDAGVEVLEGPRPAFNTEVLKRVAFVRDPDGIEVELAERASPKETHLHPDRLLPGEKQARRLARELYDGVRDLPIISPHGHTDPRWFADNERFSDPASLFLTPDHYVLRMLRSQGVSYDALGVPRKDGAPVADGRSAWRLLCANWHLFAGTPSRLWVEHSLQQFFGIEEPLSAANADALYEAIDARLAAPDLRPRAILARCNVEAIATTEFALDPLRHHAKLKDDGLIGQVRTTYRPDDVTDPDVSGFSGNLARFAELTGEDTASWQGLVAAHRKRRALFRTFGATATDHGVPSALSLDLTHAEKQSLLDRARAGGLDASGAEAFRGQMLLEMAALSAEDGMVMQVHAGSRRNLDPRLMAERGANLGADIPGPTDYVRALQPLLGRFGNQDGFRLILFTLDESVYARELAPLAGYWSSVLIGPPWWFHDSPNGIRRFFDAVVETAGFYNLAGFNDDTRALLSIPARHDVWRRETARFLSQQVMEHRLSMGSAREIAAHLSYGAAKQAYRL